MELRLLKRPNYYYLLRYVSTEYYCKKCAYLIKNDQYGEEILLDYRVDTSDIQLNMKLA